MKRPDFAKVKRMIGGKGLYIGVAACMIAVGGVGAATYNKAVKRINDGLSNTTPSITESRKADIYTDEKLADVPKDNSSAAESEVGSTSDSSREEAVSKPDKPVISQPNVMPVNGEIITPFSFGELVKSETLEVWKTHDGIDIKAEKGSPVKAMNRGEVTKIWDDPLWGFCASIDHGNGIVSYYYSLSASMMIKEGDTVDSGQVIGSVGDTAEIEAAEPSHLHFALKRNGEWTDPVSYIDPYTNK